MPTRPFRLLAVALLAFGCSRRSDDGLISIRLLDQVDAPVVDSAIDLSRPDALAASAYAVRGRDAFERGVPPAESPSRCVLAASSLAPLLKTLGPPPEGAAADAPEDGLALASGEALIELFPVAPQTRCTATIDARGRGAIGFVVALDAAPRPDELKHPRFLLESFGRSGGQVVRCEPSQGALRAELVTSERTEGLLFVVFAHGGKVGVGSLELGVETDSAAQLRAPPLRDARPHLRRVEVGLDHRESLVAHAPAKLTLAPARAGGRLRFGFACLEGARSPALAIEVACGGARRRFDFAAAALARPEWQECELELASGDAPIEFTVQGAPLDGEPPPAFAIAEPRIEKGDFEPARERPDVVLISLDTVRADRLQPYGADRATSPHLARFVERARVFDAATSAAAYTLPAHASLFTGQLPERHGVIGQDRRLGADRPALLAEAFRSAGYRTVAFTGGGYLDPAFGFARGFERYSTADIGRAFGGARPPASAVYRRQEEALKTVAAPLERLERLLAEPRSEPLFLFVHTYAAHNYAAPEPLMREVGADPAALAPWLGDLSLMRFSQVATAQRGDDAAIARLKSLYDASVRVADEVFGAVLGALERSGRDRGAWIIVVSDHGEALFEHGDFGHGFSLHEEILRVPLLFAGFDVRPGRVPDVVSLVDVAPTLAELCGLPAFAPCDGGSLVPLLEDRARAGDVALATADDAQKRRIHALRGTKLKWIGDGLGHGELFDLAADPLERTDRAGDDPERAARLDRALRERVESLRKGGQTAGEADVDAAGRQALRELGYH